MATSIPKIEKSLAHSGSPLEILNSKKNPKIKEKYNIKWKEQFIPPSLF